MKARWQQYIPLLSRFSCIRCIEENSGFLQAIRKHQTAYSNYYPRAFKMINPLHLPVRSCQHSNYSTLSGALMDQQHRSSSSIKRLPQPVYSPSCKFHNATSRLGPLLPAITFEYVGHSSKQGVKMQHLATRDCSYTITGGNEKILVSNGQQRTVTFRILASVHNSIL